VLQRWVLASGGSRSPLAKIEQVSVDRTDGGAELGQVDDLDATGFQDGSPLTANEERRLCQGEDDAPDARGQEVLRTRALPGQANAARFQR
jgi:hypothetical protein